MKIGIEYKFYKKRSHLCKTVISYSVGVGGSLVAPSCIPCTPKGVQGMHGRASQRDSAFR
ncbi:hypothetical protein COCOBI_pt-1400 (chloroplast) [Coccomyxa sp. Obi]|nr:hypothetical protein COCOBI_pt-1400 [Coccomyxa sp. Obi]